MRTSILLNGSFALVSVVALACGSSGSDGGGTAGTADGTGGASIGGGGSTQTGGSNSSSGGGAGSATGGNAAGGAVGSGGSIGSGGRDSAPGGATGTGGTAGSGGAGGGTTTGIGGASGGVDASRDTGSDAGTRGTGGANRDASSDATSAGDGALPNVTVWIAGDSTVATGTAPCPIGWGGQFKPYFNNRVTIVNSAVAGRSVRTWLYNVETTMDATGECVLDRDGSGNPTVQAHWQAMLDGMKAGDYLFIQFGINDGDPTCPRHVGLDAFVQSYGVMAQAATDRGAHPIFLTPTSAIACTGNVAHGTRGGYVTSTQQAGTMFGVPVIDLHALTVTLYNSLSFCPIPGGVDVTATTTGPVGDFFCDDHTHFSPTGAVRIAQVVADAVRAQGIPLGAYRQ
ncbi:MAG TPA: hypothetical protein VGL13_10330 [Polyangiaceae bacterium]